MLSIAERHKFILDKLNTFGFVRITDIANERGVTKVTIRKDIRLLEEQGARVWFTDSFPQPGREPSCWSSADFTIREDGVILPPDRG